MEKKINIPKEMTEQQLDLILYPDLGDDFNLITSKIPTGVMDSIHGRVYFDKDSDADEKVYFYSVTTIENAMSKGLGFDMWLGNSPSYSLAMDYGMERADFGTMIHALCMYLGWGKTIDCDKGFYNHRKGNVLPIGSKAKKSLQAYIDWYKENNVELVATEISLYNPIKDDEGFIYPYAGTADILCKINGKLCLVDIKTGKEYQKTHELQLTAYKMLCDSLYSNEIGTIDEMYCLYLKDSGKYKMMKYNFVPDRWFNLLDIFFYSIETKTGRMPKLKMKEELPRFYKLNEKEENDG
tara:strand:- start:554 stop:1441 length:888 start_codon:yes stop_codon:yes gene_type:complete